MSVIRSQGTQGSSVFLGHLAEGGRDEVWSVGAGVRSGRLRGQARAVSGTPSAPPGMCLLPRLRVLLPRLTCYVTPCGLALSSGLGCHLCVLWPLGAALPRVARLRI